MAFYNVAFSKSCYVAILALGEPYHGSLGGENYNFVELGQIGQEIVDTRSLGMAPAVFSLQIHILSVLHNHCETSRVNLHPK